MDFDEITHRIKQESASSSSMTMLQEDKESMGRVSPNSSMVETMPIEAIFFKTEEEPEVMICEASIKQESLLCNEPESVEEVKDLQGTDDDLCESSSSSTEKAFVCPLVLRRDKSSVISDKNNIGSVSLREVAVSLLYLEAKHLTASFSETNGLSNRGLKRCCEQLQSMTVLEEERRNTRMLLSSDCVANKGHLEHKMIKEENNYEVTIKQESLLWDEPNLEEDFKVIGGADTGSSNSNSASAVKLSAWSPVLGGDRGSSVKAHGSRLFACSSCKFRTNYKSSLKAHLRTHESVRDKPFACSKCEYRSNWKGGLRRHLRTHESVRDKPFACSKCEYRSDVTTDLKKHLLTHETDRDKQFACSKCEYRSNSKSYLRKHLLTHRTVIDHEIVRDKPYACSKCVYRSNYKDSLKIHLRTHESVRDKPYACSKCEYRSDYKNHLKTHLRTHESVRDKPFACSKCEYRSDGKYLLKKHLRIHESVRDKPFACSKCEYRSDVKLSLRKHLRTHESVRDKPFACSKCEYRSDDKYLLKKHLRIHESVRDKPFACSKCEYRFYKKDSLKKHLRTHDLTGSAGHSRTHN